MGAIVPAGACTYVTPLQAGAAASGANADAGSYALEPAATSTPTGLVVLYLVASLSTPDRQVPDPSTNFYNAASRSGHHLLALAYRSTQVVGVNCTTDACFESTRNTLVTGQVDSSTPTNLKDMQADEAIVSRFEAALKYLAQVRPDGAWGQYLDSGGHPNWAKVIVAGHSQGGGHAAYIGQLFGVSRVIQLSSTCDITSKAPITPAAWTSATGNTWATSPALAYYGLGASGDSIICPGHVAVWQNMGMAAERQHDGAELCGKGNATSHEAPMSCIDNYPRWLQMLQ